MFKKIFTLLEKTAIRGRSSLTGFTFFSCPSLAQGTRRKNAVLKLENPCANSFFSLLCHGKCFARKKIRSITGDEVEGYFFSRCFDGSKDKILKESSLIDGLVEIEAFSLKNGAGILGIDISGEPLAHKWGAVCAKLKIPLTTGKSLIAWSAYEAIYRMAHLRRIDLKNTSLAAIGISDSAVALCCKKLSGVVKRIAIFDPDKDKAKRLSEETLFLNPKIEISLADTIDAAVKGSDIVLLSGDLQDELNFLDTINPGGIVCYIFNPGMSLQKRNPFRGAGFISAGFIRLPRANNLRLIKGLPQNVVFAAMAETMLLALEGKFADYSGSEDTNIDKMEEIADIAARHGFEVWVPEAPLYI
ncbi:MAG: hypothetical protein NTU54_07240 [Candidatus Omnitrophica bacterium]|nr:hypothetical protein [Candidatus Omnitrophota bacterium]